MVLGLLDCGARSIFNIGSRGGRRRIVCLIVLDGLGRVQGIKVMTHGAGRFGVVTMSHICVELYDKMDDVVMADHVAWSDTGD